MAGENIQRAREDIQLLRGQLIGGLGFGDKLFSSNPGILANFQVGKRVQERLQTMRRTTNRPPAARTKKGEEEVFIDRPEEIRKTERVRSV